MTAGSHNSRKEAILRLGKQRLDKRRRARERFRRMRQSREKAAASATDQEEHSDPSILLLMSDEQKQALLERLLNEHGFRTFRAEDLRSALTLMSQEIPEILVLEVEGGATALYQLLAQFRSLDKLRELPILVILSPRDSDHEERFSHIPCVKAILRPFTHTQIAGAMQDLLDSSLPEGASSSDDLTV